MIMKKMKFFLIFSIIFISLILSLSTNCYAEIISIDVNGVEMQFDYTSPVLEEEDYKQIEMTVENYIKIKEIENEIEYRIDTYEEVLETVDQLVEEKEAEKKLEAEKEKERRAKEKIRETEKEQLAQLEKEYLIEKNKIPNAGDTTILVLKAITVVSIIILVVVIICNQKMKK